MSLSSDAPTRAATQGPLRGLLSLLVASSPLPACAPAGEPEPAPQGIVAAQVARGDELVGGTPEGVDVATIRFGPAPLGTKTHDPLAGYPSGERQRRIVCDRPGTNPVKAVFCGASAPAITSLVALQRALGLDFREPASASTPTTSGASAPRAPYPPGASAATSGAYPSSASAPAASAPAVGARPYQLYPTPAAGTSPYPAPTAGTSPYPPSSSSGTGRGNPQFALTAHSTSLVTRITSAINPRAIIFRQSGLELVAMGYARGEQFVELVARERTGELGFFLLRFRQACNDTPSGCGPGDLYTSAAERDWTSYSLYGAEDLRNSVMDCAPCHQPDGPSAAPILRMQEHLTPWTHWLRSNTVGGATLLDDYFAAKGGEGYAGIPGSLIAQSSPFALQSFVANQGYGRAQSNEFVSTLIEEEVARSAPQQPAINRPPGKSPTWDAIYERSVKGEAMAVPYHDVKVTDPDKLASLTSAYARFRAGALPASELPDLSQIFPSDRATLAEIGFAPKPGLDGAGLVRQLCTPCHNDKLDQAGSRARFNVDLATLDREERYLAAQRVLLPEDDLRAMPPQRFRTLTAEERRALADTLAP